MTTARLSPAANLLRNSKLFSLPPSVPLPPSRPTSEPVASSDTATTVHPVKAAINTPLTAQGDWGLKRNLPGKSFQKTKTPVIRLRGGLDAPEHIADFEPAGDHVLTLHKWHDVPVVMRHPVQKTAVRTEARSDFTKNVFNSSYDNTTTEIPRTHSVAQAKEEAVQLPEHLKQAKENFLRSEAAIHPELLDASRSNRSPNARPTLKKRWRYDGPWLAGMTNLEFDAYLNQLDQNRLREFREHVRRRLLDQKFRTRAQARIEEGISEANEPEMSLGAGGGAPEDVHHEEPSLEVTDDELSEALRALRQDPGSFGVDIAAFLDLPDGPDRGPLMNATGSLRDSHNDWKYGRNTAAAEMFRNTGPPRTHPSAGFSYLRSLQFARNDPERGPLKPLTILPGRVLKEMDRPLGSTRGVQHVGVGGIVAALSADSRLRQDRGERWRPQPGGPRIPVHMRDAEASVQQNGALEFTANVARDYGLDKSNMPVNSFDRPRYTTPHDAPTSLPRLDENVSYRSAVPVEALRKDDPGDKELAELLRNTQLR